MEIMGLPPGYLVDSASRRKVFFDSHGNPTIVPNSRGEYAEYCAAVASDYVMSVHQAPHNQGQQQHNILQQYLSRPG
jgi:hypothetical protein